MGIADIVLTVEQEPEISLTVTEAKLKPEQDKTVTPTYSEQTVLPDAGMTLGSVTVEPIPEPTERLTITENGSYDVARIGGVDVDVPQGVFPEGTLEVDENGTYDIREYAQVDVDVNPPAPSQLLQLYDFDTEGYPHTLRISVSGVPAPFFCRKCGYDGGLPYSGAGFNYRIDRIIIDEGLTQIVNRMFEYCQLITEMHLPGTIQYIMTNAFGDCTNLRDIYVPWSEGEIKGAPWGATNATIHYNWEG